MIVNDYPSGVSPWHVDKIAAAKVRACLPELKGSEAAAIVLLELVGDTFLENVFWWDVGLLAFVAQVQWKEWGPGVWWLSPRVIERPPLIPAALALRAIRAGRARDRAWRRQCEIAEQIATGRLRLPGGSS